MPVTVSPLLADPVIHYDGIWVAGLTADAWPPALRTDAFLPVEIQRQVGMAGATAEGQIAEARVLMRAWQRIGRRAGVERGQALGRYRADAESAACGECAAASARRSKGGWLARTVRRAGALESVVDTSGTPFTAGARLPGGTYVLQLQNDCPFHAYAQFRLGCEDRRPPAPGVEPDIRGRLLHGALEQLWRTLRDSQTLLAMDQGACQVLIEKSIDTAAARALGRWRADAAAAA